MLKKLQAGAVPFRVLDARTEFLLVTSRKGNWIFPKGVVEPGETPEDTALKEVEEEAGLRGRVLPTPLGSYGDRKSWTECEVVMFLFEYAEESPSWGEAGSRARRWCGFEEASSLLDRGDLRRLLRTAKERLDARSRAAAERG